jgi:hypothetical protein
MGMDLTPCQIIGGIRAMNMRRSRVLDKLRNGEVVSCFKTNLADSRTVEIAAMAGFDCVWTCMEHIWKKDNFYSYDPVLIPPRNLIPFFSARATSFSMSSAVIAI